MQDQADPIRKADKIANEQWLLIMIALAISVGAILYRVAFKVGFGHTSLLFLGLPTVLACLLAMTPRSKSATGGIFKGLTFFLLIIAPLLGEGYLCIVFASPLFFLVGVIVGGIADWSRRRKGVYRNSLLLLLVPLCLEGVVPGLTPNRSQTVTVTRLIAATPAQVEAKLTAVPNIATPLPRLLRIGFPRPLQAETNGLDLNATRTFHFSGAEGDPPGDLRLQVTARRPGFVRMQTIADTSKLRQWVAWRSTDIEWHATDPTHTLVTASITFDRQLDPAWYFTPWERLAVRSALRYLIETNAAPEATR